MKLFGTKDIKVFIKKILLSKKDELANKIVLDIPAGSGYSTEILKNINANVEAYDLFPEFFNVEGLKCKKADLEDILPIESNYADFVLCQEGVEHLPNQLHLLSELNRVLKKQGKLILTTPNDSKLRSKLSYYLSESEYFYKIMPPNELDSIWFSNSDKSNNIYYGHIFLIGVQKLRVLAKLAGFKIKKIHHFRINHTSLLLLLLSYPFILLVNFLGYLRAIKKINNSEKFNSKKTYLENLKLAIDPRILTDGHLIVEFEKVMETDDVKSTLQNKFKDVNIVT